MSTQIVERGEYRVGSRVVLPEGKGVKGRIRLMGWEPGAKIVEGSSADYPVKVIKRDFAESHPAGTRIRANHDGLCEAGGDIRRILGKTISDPVAERDGMYADAIFDEQWLPWMEKFADVVGMSITAGVEFEPQEFPEDQERDDYGRPVDENGEVIPKVVSRFLTATESPYNSVDVVEAPGADGAIVAIAVEAAIQRFNNINVREMATFALDTRKPPKTSEATPPRDTKKEKKMDPDEVQALVEQAASAAVTRYAESQRPTPSEQPTLGTMAEAVVKAGLTEAGRREVYARVDRGEAFEDALAAETQREADIEAEVERRVSERLEATREGQSFTGFGFTDDKTGAPLGTESSDRKVLAEREAEFDAAMEG